MIDKNEQKKEKILKLLSDKKDWITTSTVRELINIHQYKAEMLLNQLFNEGKIMMEKRSTYTFWRNKI